MTEEENSKKVPTEDEHSEEEEDKKEEESTIPLIYQAKLEFYHLKIHCYKKYLV